MHKTLYNVLVRMNRLNSLKALWMVLVMTLFCAAAFAVDRFAAIHYTHHGKQFKGYRVSDECYIPIQYLTEIGWTCTIGEKNAKVVAEGKTFNVPFKVIDAKECLPLRKCINLMGGASSWTAGGYDSLEIASAITSVTCHNGKISLQSSLEVQPSLTVMGQKKVFIDLDGAKLSLKAKIDVDPSVTVLQYRPDVVRIVYMLDKGQSVPQLELEPSQNLTFDFTGKTDTAMAVLFKPNQDKKSQTEAKKTTLKQEIGKGDDEKSSAIKEELSKKESNKSDGLKQEPVVKTDSKQEPKKSEQKTEVAKGSSQIKSPIEIPLPINILGEGKANVDLALKFPKGFFDGKATSKVIDNQTIELVLPGTRCFLPRVFKLKSELIKDVETSYDENATVMRIITELPMTAKIESAQDLVYVSLVGTVTDSQITGDLSGKTIYVDPGHGADDLGASYAGVSEKNIALKISKVVEKALTEAGAKVIMSRVDDSFPSLTQRPQEANMRGADAFISIHVNKVEPAPYIKAGKPLPSGTMTFFHGDNTEHKRLASSIHSQLMSRNLLPDLGVKSDYAIYPGKGFAVLRYSKMPAILLETGFIMHPKDREVIQTPEFAQATAQSIVEGLKLYFKK